MKNEKLIKYLKDELGYSEFEIGITLEELESIDQESYSMIEALLDDQDISGYAYRDYSVGSLVLDKGFNLVSAVIAISDLKDDYEYYSELFSRPIK